jgi:hypothetical protein
MMPALIRRGRDFLAGMTGRSQRTDPPFMLSDCPLEPTRENIERAMRANRCFHCGNNEFYEGPSGGMSQNIKCTCCGQKLNVAIFNSQLIMAEDIGVDTEMRTLFETDPDYRKSKALKIRL